MNIRQTLVYIAFYTALTVKRKALLDTKPFTLNEMSFNLGIGGLKCI